jgi:hypothetical protein
VGIVVLPYWSLPLSDGGQMLLPLLRAPLRLEQKPHSNEGQGATVAKRQ